MEFLVGSFYWATSMNSLFNSADPKVHICIISRDRLHCFAISILRLLMFSEISSWPFPELGLNLDV